jgi:hypothetical protein
MLRIIYGLVKVRKEDMNIWNKDGKSVLDDVVARLEKPPKDPGD